MTRALWLIIVSLMIASAASGQTPQRDPLRVGVLRDWPPYYTMDENGRPDGFAVETFEAIAERAGLESHYVIYRTFPQLQDALSTGEIDVIPNFGKIEGRDLLFSSPIDTFSIRFFIRTSIPGSPDLDHVSGPVAVVRSNVGERIASAHDPPLDVQVYGSIREAIFRLIAGDVDGLIYPGPVVWALAREAGVDDRIESTGPELMEVKRAIGVTPGRQDLVARLDSAIEPFVVSEEYESIRKRWLAPAPPFWTVKRVVIAALSLIGLVVVAFTILHILSLRRAAAFLRRSEERYRTLFESIQDAIIVADTGRRIVAMNPAFGKLFGYQAEEIIGSLTRVLYANESEFESMGEELRTLQSDSNFIRIITYRTRDGRSFKGETNAFYLYNDQGSSMGLVGIIRDVTQELENRAELEQKRGDLERLSAQLIGAQETERARIARELHDELGGILTALYFDVIWLRDHVDDPAPLQRIATMGDQIEKATKRIRDVARDLRPKVIDDFGLVPALEDLVSEFSDKFGIEGDLAVDSQGITLRRDVDINIYRIIQEALTNVARHSGANRVELTLRLTNGSIIAEVRDDGRGASLEDFQSSSSLGIVGMRERAEMLGGTLTIEASAGSGTTVRAQIPISRSGP